MHLATIKNFDSKTKYWVKYSQVTGGDWPGIHASFAFISADGRMCGWYTEGFFPFDKIEKFQVIKYKSLPKELKGKE